MKSWALTAACFVESLAVILLERGVYFYMKDALDFSDAANLWMGLIMGLFYIAGALASHGLAKRMGEKRLLYITLHCHIAIAAVAMLIPGPVVMAALFCLVGLFSGAYWPVVESYITAGKTGKAMLKAVGRFCLSWSLGVPAAMAVAGVMIDSAWAESLFALIIGCHLFTLWLLRGLPKRPKHTPADHPDLPNAMKRARYAVLLRSGRWSMLGGYAMLFMLAPLLPGIFTERLGLSNTVGTPLVSLLDWARVAAFAGLMWMTFWYGRASTMVVGVLLMPVGFLMILFGHTLWWVLVGEVLFGLTTGMVYYTALYYALAIKNAAVDAGGGHEALIGGGFALGPIAGLIGIRLGVALDDELMGNALGVLPLILLAVLGGLLPLLSLLRVRSAK